jgi:general stress protein 26
MRDAETMPWGRFLHSSMGFPRALFPDSAFRIRRYPSETTTRTMTSTEKKLDDLYDLIDGIEVAMFTTRRPDGHLVTRPMQVQERTAGTDLWLVTDIETHKLDELAHDPHVNLGFYNTRTREWVSVSGTAIVTQDRDLVRGLYKPDWKAWFPKIDDARDGGPSDPRIALILVEAHSAIYMKNDKPRPIVLFEVVKALVTGRAPAIGEEHIIGPREMERAQRLERERRAEL